MSRTENKLTQAVFSYPQAQKMVLVHSYTFCETSTRRLQQILSFLGKYKKTKVARIRHPRVASGSKLIKDPALLPRRYTELHIDLGSGAWTLFHLGTDVRYPYVSVGAKEHTYRTISKHRYELAICFFAINAPTSTSYVVGLQLIPTFHLRCPSTSKNFRKVCLFAHLLVQYAFGNFSTDTAPISTKFGRNCQSAPKKLIRRSDGSLRVYLGFRLGTNTQRAKSVTTPNVTAGKRGSNVAPLVTALPQYLN